MTNYPNTIIKKDEYNKIRKYEMIGAYDESNDCLLSLKYIGLYDTSKKIGEDNIVMYVEIDVKKIVFHLMM